MTQEQYLEVKNFYKKEPEYLEIPAIWRKEIESKEMSWEELHGITQDENGEWN